MIFKIDPYRSLLSKVEEKGLGVNPEEVIREWEKIRGNDEKRGIMEKGLYTAGEFTAIKKDNDKIEFDGFGVARFDLKTKELEKIIEGNYGIIEGLSGHKNEIYMGGDFTEIGTGNDKIELYGRGVVAYNLETRRLRKVIDGANDDICGLFTDKDKGYLYIAGNFTKIETNDRRIKLYRLGIVRYDFRSGEIRKVIDGANGRITTLFIYENGLYISGNFTEIGTGNDKIEFDGFGVARFDLKTKELEKIIEGFDNGIWGLSGHKNEIYMGGDFTEIGTGNDKIELYGRGVVAYNLETRRLRKVIDGANSEIKSLFVDGYNLYMCGYFTEIGTGNDKIEFDGFGVARYNLETEELKKVIDGANGQIETLFIHPTHSKR